MFFVTFFLVVGCSGNNIVSDPKTGLIWQDDQDSKTLKKSWLTKEAYESEKFLDTAGDTAMSYCNDLILAGYKDWRLPLENELATIVAKAKENPSILPMFKNVSSAPYWTANTAGEDLISMSINGQAMDSNVTIEKDEKKQDNAFAFAARVIYFSHGKHGSSDKQSFHNIRCVRANSE